MYLDDFFEDCYKTHSQFEYILQIALGLKSRWTLRGLKLSKYEDFDCDPLWSSIALFLLYTKIWNDLPIYENLPFVTEY